MHRAVVLGVAVLVLCGCESDSNGGSGEPEACEVEAPTSCPSDAPTYADVAPIFEERCVICHRGEASPSELCPTCWELSDYSHVKSWESEIRGVILTCQMPPPDSGKTMTNTERAEILDWIRCGAPE